MRPSPFGDGRHLRAHPRDEVCSLAHQLARLIGRLARLSSGVEQYSIHIQNGIPRAQGRLAPDWPLGSASGGAPVARQPDATPTYRGLAGASSVSGVKVRRKQLLHSQSRQFSGLASEVCASGEKFAAHLSHGNSGTKCTASYCAVCGVH